LKWKTVDFVSVNREDIAHAIRAMGVSGGDLLLSHSSLKSLGHVEGGASAAAQALVDAVSPGGSAFVPTFNFGDLPFDPLTTPSLTGAITEAFRLLPGALRSGQPTHPVAGIGPQAREILADHAQATPFGVGSPLWRLWRDNAWVLLIGVDHTVNSTIHVAEEVEQIPYIHATRGARIITAGGTMEVSVRRPGCSNGFNKIAPALEGKIIRSRVGDAPLWLMRAGDVVSAASGMLRRNPASLLCDRDECTTCGEARRQLERAFGQDV
jgi:aminoglycoside 3-N-acetyltransferase